MTTRFYANKAAAAVLTSDATSGATTLSLDTVSGFPSQFPFTLVLEPGTVNVEVVSVTAIVGTNVTVQRGQDGTTAVSHASGSAVLHAHSAQDFRNSRDHENATSGVHGVTGAMVGTTDSQTLTNKNLTATTNQFPSTLVTLTGTQVLTGKDLSAGNIFPASLVTLTGTQVLVNKTLGSPTITTPTISTPTITDPTINGTAIAAAWSSYTPTWSNTGTPAPSVGNGTLTGHYIQIGKMVFFSIELTFGSSTTAGSGNAWKFSLPVAAKREGSVGAARVFDNSANDNRNGAAFVDPSDLTTLRPLAAGGSLSTTLPWTWANNDVLYINGCYEAA